MTDFGLVLPQSTLSSSPSRFLTLRSAPVVNWFKSAAARKSAFHLKSRQKEIGGKQATQPETAVLVLDEMRGRVSRAGYTIVLERLKKYNGKWGQKLLV